MKISKTSMNSIQMEINILGKRKQAKNMELENIYLKIEATMKGAGEII
jgi:hypothetical protein